MLTMRGGAVPIKDGTVARVANVVAGTNITYQYVPQAKSSSQHSTNSIPSSDGQPGPTSPQSKPGWRNAPQIAAASQAHQEKSGSKSKKTAPSPNGRLRNSQTKHSNGTSPSQPASHRDSISCAMRLCRRIPARRRASVISL